MAPKTPETNPLPPEAHEGSIEPVISDDDFSVVKNPPMIIVWRNVALFTLLHFSAIYSIFLIPLARIYTLLWFILLYIVSGLGITAGAHRLWAHRSYKAKLPLRILLAFFNSISFQNHIYEWSRDHRTHHKFSETNADPHNARRGFFFAHIGWLLVKKHPDVKTKGAMMDFSDLRKDPVVMFQKKFYLPATLLSCFALPALVPWYVWGESMWNSYFLAVILRYTLVLNATWLVNSAAHMWGNKPYDMHINPVQNLGVSFLANGEGYHNYHHTFPHDYATSEFGWRVNLTTAFIDCMGFLGQAYDRRKISSDVIRKRQARTGDGST